MREVIYGLFSTEVFALGSDSMLFYVIEAQSS